MPKLWEGAVSCFWNHRWSKWEQYDFKVNLPKGSIIGLTTPPTELRQRRTCKKCGKMQDERVRMGYI